MNTTQDANETLTRTLSLVARGLELNEFLHYSITPCGRRASRAKRNDASSPRLHGFVVNNIRRRQQDPFNARRFELLDPRRALVGSSGDGKAVQEVIRD